MRTGEAAESRRGRGDEHHCRGGAEEAELVHTHIHVHSWLIIHVPMAYSTHLIFSGDAAGFAFLSSSSSASSSASPSVVASSMSRLDFDPTQGQGRSEVTHQCEEGHRCVSNGTACGDW